LVPLLDGLNSAAKERTWPQPVSTVLWSPTARNKGTRE
jgi:hypothetical protein